MSAQSAPGRFRANEEKARCLARPMLPFIRNKDAAEPSPQQWATMAVALTEGDPHADALASWLVTQPNGERFKLFERALAGESVENLPAPLAALMSTALDEPQWLQRERLPRAAAVTARSGQTGMRILRDFGLMAGYQASAINQTLVKTGALKKGAARRVAETTKWWMDCTEPDAMAPYQVGFVSTLRVRVIHALVRRQLLQRDDWDHAYLGMPINQLDMQVTYLAFSVMFLLGTRMLGHRISSAEAEDVMHLWRYIAWLMGVDDKLLCEDEQQGRTALYQNLLCQATADETTRQLGAALRDEPLSRHYKAVSAPWACAIGWPAVHAHWDRAVHLSIVRLAVSQQGMAGLGLSRFTLPWYPALFAPINFTISRISCAIPGAKAQQEKRGRKRQHRQLAILFGDSRPELTSAAGLS